jgi:methionyl-tRNA synthetase
LSFINTQFDSEIPQPEASDEDTQQIRGTVKEKVDTIAAEIEDCRLQSAVNDVIGISRAGNQYLNEKEPWNLIKKNRTQATGILCAASQAVKTLAVVSSPFIPHAAQEIWKYLNLPGNVDEQTWEEALKPLPANHRIAKAKPIFRKIDATEQELGESLAKAREKVANVA